MVADVGRHIGSGVANLCNLLNPSRVVLGGDLAEAGELVLGPINEVVALGDNGAGKSTLVKTIAGVHPIDEGVIEWDGKPVQISKPHDAQNLGIATVYQDLALCDNIDVVGNFYLGRELRRRGVLDEVEMQAPLPRAPRHPVDPHPQRPHPDRLAVRWSAPGGRHRPVHARRAQAGHPGRAHRGPRRRRADAQVLDLVERLRERGHAVILISHNMADVKAVADKVAVLRLGRNNGVFEVKSTSQEEIISAITGATDNAVTRRAARTNREIKK
ncbi:D-xylose transport system ATP-binding protein OS=Streptomyces albaduncus OX=68172 GN=FHS32_001451 PE=4 SV=1 [Streptomyces griseoloalbus]